MKKLLAVALMSAVASVASADTYPDSAGENFTPIAHIDILSVEVMNDLSDITFSITVAGANAGWGNFMIGIDSIGANGDAAGNAWGRPITFSANPIDYWVGGWTDGGGGSQLWSYNGAWNAETAPGYSFAGDNITFTVPLANLGLSVNDTFSFDVFSSGTGGTDGAVDALSNPGQTIADWANSYDATLVSSYTVVPEPASLSLLALGGLTVALIRRRRV